MSKPVVKFIDHPLLGKCPECEVFIRKTKFGWYIQIEFEECGYNLMWFGSFGGTTETGVEERHFGWYVSTGKGKEHKNYGKIEIHGLDTRDMLWTIHTTKYGEISCLIRHSQAFPELPYDVEVKHKHKKKRAKRKTA